MKKPTVGNLAGTLTFILLAWVFPLIAAPVAGADPITPDEWGMDDGIGVGTRTAGTRCLPSETHQWAEPG